MASYGTDPAGNQLDRFGLSRPVWLLGWISFFTDTASEMVYPLLPLFLIHVIGAGAMSLGVIEGVAEGANSVLKIVSGRISDRTGQPKKLVLAGYGLSSLVRPLIGFVTAWPQVLALRFTDRLGKGLRSSPRDALLARFAPEKTRGRVYGFHRAMDHAGAVTGPLVATAYLYFYPKRIVRFSCGRWFPGWSSSSWSFGCRTSRAATRRFLFRRSNRLGL
jgi:sugar phosphate permease